VSNAWTQSCEFEVRGRRVAPPSRIHNCTGESNLHRPRSPTAARSARVGNLAHRRVRSLQPRFPRSRCGACFGGRGTTSSVSP
jgi:hypothetical protein